MNHASRTTRTDRRLRAAGFRPDDHGVSEIVGSMLLIAITVLMVSGLAILILNVKPPADTLHADLNVLLARGPDGVWGTGDEQLRVDHVGGEPVPREGFSIQVDIGGTVHSFADAGLTGAFDDGELTIGETWSTTLTIPIATAVNVQMILEGGGGQSNLIHSSTVLSGGSCDPDNVAPTVAEWTQSPSDVTALSSGSVTITVELIDGCSGVDESVAPHLEYRINDGSDPAWTDTGAMSAAGTATWTGTIPSQTWLTLLGDSLQYRVTGMTDTDGNNATSSHQSDVIQFIGSSNTYTDGHTANVGTVSNFGNAQSASDGGAVATLTEATDNPPIVKYATSASGSGGIGDLNNAAGAPDDAYHVLDSSNDLVTVTTFGTGSGTITKVEFIFQGHYEGTRSDDTVDLRANPGSGFSTVFNGLVPTTTDSDQVVDITGLRGSWSWSDIDTLQLRASYVKNAAQDAMTVHVDAMWVRVTVQSNTDMDIELEFPALPGSAVHVLEVNYAVTQDTFAVEVWNGAITGWVPRGSTLDQASQTTWVYQLTAAEAIADGGSPLIRIVDDSGASGQGTVTLDWVRVVSA